MMNTRSMMASAALLLAALFTASVFSLKKVETLRGKEATLEEVLYLPSGKTLKRMSLGYNGLLAVCLRHRSTASREASSSRSLANTVNGTAIGLIG